MMFSSLVFTGSDHKGFKSEIRLTENGYSVFTWMDTEKTGLVLWREKHGIELWPIAFDIASEWIK